MSDFQTVNLKAYNNYNSMMPPPVFSPITKINLLNNGNSGIESTLQPNISAYNEFIATAVKKKSAYVIAAEDDEWQCIYEMAQETVILI